MSKTCLICNDDFTTTKGIKYCSPKCQREARVGILLPDENKKYKYQMPKGQGQKWAINKKHI